MYVFSPLWLALRRLRGCEVESTELDEILQEQAETKGMRPRRPWELFTDRSVRWQLISVIIISSAMQLCGNDSVSSPVWVFHWGLLSWYKRLIMQLLEVWSIAVFFFSLLLRKKIQQFFTDLQIMYSNIIWCSCGQGFLWWMLGMLVGNLEGFLRAARLSCQVCVWTLCSLQFVLKRVYYCRQLQKHHNKCVKEPQLFLCMISTIFSFKKENGRQYITYIILSWNL